MLQRGIVLLWVSTQHLYLTFITSFLTFAVLHPWHKLEYFKQAKWEQDWIDTALDLVREMYDSSYALLEVEEETLEHEAEEEITQVCAQTLFRLDQGYLT